MYSVLMFHYLRLLLRWRFSTNVQQLLYYTSNPLFERTLCQPCPQRFIHLEARSFQSLLANSLTLDEDIYYILEINLYSHRTERACYKSKSTTCFISSQAHNYKINIIFFMITLVFLGLVTRRTVQTFKLFNLI